jgi:alpha-L-rhamnosidase
MSSASRTSWLPVAGLALTLAVPAVFGTTSPAATASPPSTTGVSVVDLAVNGRYDAPLGLGDARPSLSWRMTGDGLAAAKCRAARGICPLDRQVAYEIEAAESEASLSAGELIWDTGRVPSGRQTDVRFGPELESRDQVAWRVRVWDAENEVSTWSDPEMFSVGLLEQSDWGQARWIEDAGRVESDPLPILARQFRVPEDKEVASADLYLAGVGMHHATVNGEEITDEVLAPGYSNYQVSTEYRTYDVTDEIESGDNAIGVELGHGPAYVRRSMTNPAVGRTHPFTWWQSALKGSGTLVTDLPAGATTVRLNSVADYHVGGTINIDTGDGGERLESRTITAIGTAGAQGTGITVTPALSRAHSANALVTGSGNNIAASDPAAGAAVTPRVIGRLELSYTDGTSQTIVTDRDWRTASGPLVTNSWYAGSDYDSRREQVGWDEPGADLTTAATRRDGSAMNWEPAGFAPPPNLATKLVARSGDVIREQERFTPTEVTNPAPGTWVFNFGQNFAGWPELDLDQVPAGTTIKMQPAESLRPDGTVDSASLMGGSAASHGNQVFNSYVAHGNGDGETWHPDFNYFGMQWVQVTGLPEGYTPSKDLITGVRLQADTPTAGTFDSSNARINRIHKMSRYSFASNIMSVLTDCPGREKLSYPADYTMPFESIYRNNELAAMLRESMRHLVEAQSVADTPMAGNVPLKTPVFDWGYTGRFGDEINWGNAIILVPSFLHEYYGDTATAERYYPQMMKYFDYIQRQKVGTGANAHIVNAGLADWVGAESTSGRITGTWGYYVMTIKMVELAEATGHPSDASRFRDLADDIKAAYNNAFLNEDLGYYTADGSTAAGASQAAQALALDAGLVPAEYRESVLDRLVDSIYAFHPNGEGPHLSGGTIGMAPTVRALMEADRADVLWDVLQQDDYPGYGYFMQSTSANPGGMTTIGEQWNRSNSKNHMILAQIDEWFQSGLAGIQEGSEGFNEWGDIVVKPQVVGDLTFVKGSYRAPQGEVRSEWTKSDGQLKLKVDIPANSSGEIWVPTGGERAKAIPPRASFERIEGDYAVYSVGAGTFQFVSQP